MPPTTHPTADAVSVLREAAQALLDEYRTLVGSAYCQCDEAEDITSNLIVALAATERAAIQPSGEPTGQAEWESMCREAVAVLNRHIVPDGISDHDAFGELYGIFDSQEYRNTGAIEQDRCEARQQEEMTIDRTVATFAAQPARPDLLERLSYHANERDDMSIDDLLQVLSADRYKTVRQRTHRQLELQLLALLSAQPAPPVAAPDLTCKGKGGAYVEIGIAAGVGTSRGNLMHIYRDTVTGNLFYRTPMDFAERMERAAPAAPASAPVEAVSVLSAEHRAAIEEAAQVMESAAAHNRGKGRTVFAHAQQERADRLRRALQGKPEALALPPGTSQCSNCDGKGVIYECIVCGSEEPGAGTCGSDDPRALCNFLKANSGQTGGAA